MTEAMPWSVRGIEPEIRQDALHAAHASGQTLGQWLNGIIRDTVVDLRAAKGPSGSVSSNAHSNARQDTAGTPMTHYPAQQPLPYGTPPYAAAPMMMYPPYAMPPQPPFAAPHGYAQPQIYPFQPTYDPIEARLRALSGAETAVGSVPGSERLLKVIDAAVRSSEHKTAAAIEALATLMEKQRRADAEQQARQAALQAAHAQQAAQQASQPGFGRAAADQQTAQQAAQSDAMREIESARAELIAARDREAAAGSAVTDVTALLSKMAERLEGLEKTFADAQVSRTNEQLALARQVEDRIGDALQSLVERGPAPAVKRAAPTVSHHNADDRYDEATAAVRPPPRAGGRQRITVPRPSAAVSEITARQRVLETTGAFEPRPTPESAALDAIRSSVAALADQMRETARSRDNGRSNRDMRQELQELQEAVRELAPRKIVASVNESIRGLAQRIEQSRDEGVRESHLQPIEALLNEVRSNLMELREPRALSAINETLSGLARRIDAVGDRTTNASALAEMGQEIAEIRSIVSEARANQPFEAIRTQMNELTDKLEAVSERPRDTRVLSLLTDAIEDVRRNMSKLDPEGMFARLESRLAGLAGLEHRLDGLEALDGRIAALSRQLANTGTAANNVVDFGGLTDRIEQMTQALSSRETEADLSPLMRRIDMLQEALEQRGPGTEVKSLESIIHRLSDRIEDVRNSHASSSSLDGLQAQMSDLVQRLDRAGPQSAELGGLERTLSDLFAKVSSIPDTTAMAAQDAVKSAVRTASAPSIDPLAAEGMLLIKRDLTEMKSAQANADAKARSLLEQVNTTLEAVVTRLAKLESEPRSRPSVRQAASTDRAPPRAAPPQVQSEPEYAQQAQMQAPPVPMQPPRSPSVDAAAANVGRSVPQLARAVEPVAEPRPQTSAAPPRAQVRAENPRAESPRVEAPRVEAPRASKIQQDIDLDMPLEPGAGGAPAVGIGGDPRSNFIAAARRAAQAAASQTATAMAELEEKAAARESVGGRLESVRSTLAAQRKPILLGLAGLMVLVGGLKVASQFMDGETGIDSAPLPSRSVVQTEKPDEAKRSTEQAAAPAVEKMSVAQAPAVQPEPAPSAAAPNAAAPMEVAPPQAPAVAVIGDQSQSLDSLVAASQGLSDKLKSSALAGNLSAAYEIGSRLAEGRGGMPRDLALAARWFEHAAKKGFAPAQYRFGSFNREGLGMPKDTKVAFTWLQRSAEQGNVMAMHNLAVLYTEGVSGSVDYANAATWFRNAAEHGLKDSQFNIAVLYMRGLGVAQDQVAAYKWFAAAAKQGDGDATKRRDALFGQLPVEKQPLARQAADSFQPRKADIRSNDIIVPDGGWDGAKLPSLAVPQKKAKNV